MDGDLKLGRSLRSDDTWACLLKGSFTGCKKHTLSMRKQKMIIHIDLVIQGRFQNCCDDKFGRRALRLRCPETMPNQA